MRPAAFHFPVALLILAACRQNQPPRADPASVRGAEAAVAALAQDTAAFAGTTGVVRRTRAPAPGAPPAILRAVRVTGEAGYDRVSFLFAGDSLPGYHVEYASGEVRRCGSGDPVSIAGAARLVVRLEPAQAHDERGNPTVEQREWAPGLPAIKEMKLVCDFEGQVEWVLGVAATLRYRVLEKTAAPSHESMAPELILDVRREP